MPRRASRLLIKEHIYISVLNLLYINVFVPASERLNLQLTNITSIEKNSKNGATITRALKDIRPIIFSGQVGNVITNRNASRQEFERLLVS